MKNIFKNLWWVFLLGLALRLLLMPITLHPDLWAISFSQYFFAFKGVANIYDHLANLPLSSPLVVNYGQNFFTYPPLAYYTLGFFGLISKPFFNADFFINLSENLPNVLTDSRLSHHIFLTKLPYLFFDFGILILLVNFFEDKRDKVLVSILWLFNPLVLYTTYMVGQFDIIPVFFVILALFLAKKEKWNWAAFSLGVGGAYKMFPLFFLPFLVIYGGKNPINKIKLLIIGFLPYLLTILPFLSFASFRQNVLFSSQSQKMFFAKIPLTGAEYLSLFALFYVFLLFLFVFKKIDLWKQFFFVMLLFFALTHYHPQWYLWITPFLALFLIEYRKFWYFVPCLLLVWLFLTLSFEPSLSVGLFAPLNRGLVLVGPFTDRISFFDTFLLKSIFRSVAAGVSLAICFLIFPNDEKTS